LKEVISCKKKSTLYGRLSVTTDEERGSKEQRRGNPGPSKIAGEGLKVVFFGVCNLDTYDIPSFFI